MTGQGKTFAGPQFRGVAHAGCRFSILPVALRLVAGKILTMLYVFEASRIIKDFILGALAVEVFGVVAEITGPSGRFEGVILVFN